MSAVTYHRPFPEQLGGESEKTDAGTAGYNPASGLYKNTRGNRVAVGDACPQCAKKHLSAAFAILLAQEVLRVYEPASVCVARAWINFVEYCEGYGDHLPLVTGFLVRAEEESIRTGQTIHAAAVRELRLMVMGASDPAGLAGKLSLYGDMYRGHLLEALRELPALLETEAGTAVMALARTDFDVSGASAATKTILSCLAWIDDNFYDGPVLPPGGGGDDDMAKAAAKPAKGKPAFLMKGKGKETQAARKGGCAKKGCKK